jgi:hypothetical protein
MKKRFTITEQERKHILSLYEQDEPTETEDFTKFLEGLGFSESTNYIGTWEMKKDDNSFAITLNLSPEKNKISKATIVGPDEKLSQVQEIFNKISVPTQIASGKLLTRAPFEDKKTIEQLSSFAKSEF